jgi:hypothetical protein
MITKSAKSSIPLVGNVKLAQFTLKKKSKCLETFYLPVVDAGTDCLWLEDNSILASLIIDENLLHWNRQPHICRGICRQLPEAKKGIGNVGYTDKWKRCTGCEMYFPAKLPVGERENCPCCDRQLRDKPRHKPKVYWQGN